MEPLEIPLHLNTREAMSQLAALAAKGQQGGKDIQEGLEGASKSAKGLGVDMASILTHQGYMILKDAAQALASGFKETADYVRQVSGEYVRLREILQEVAALRGQQNTGTFTADQARQAEAAGLKPEEWVKFQSQFQSYAGAYLEGDQRKMSDSEAIKYQQNLAEFAKARGISPEQIGQLGGGVLQFSDKELTADQAMALVGKQFKTLERAPTPVSQLLPQMTRIMAQGASGEEAAQMLALMSEAMPGEEGTGVENTLKAIGQAQLKGKGGELGVTKDMSPLQRVQAAARTIKDRVGKGEDMDAIIADYFPDMREARGIKGFISRGIEGGGFGRVAGYVRDTPDDFTQAAIGEYEASDQGKYARAQAATARARIEAGERYKEVSLIRQEAERRLTERGDFEGVSLSDMINSLNVFGEDKRTRLINQESLRIAREQRGEEYSPIVDDPFKSSQSATDQKIAELIGVTKEGNEDRRRQGTKPLSAPPPRPEARQ